MKSIRINREKRLKEEPHTGHNRWHPDIPFAGTIKNGETVKIECVCAQLLL